jgi:23S rRNA (pseudouridine1915-N3)-methyltransferase
MKVKLIQTGKTSQAFVNEGFKIFEKRIKGFVPFEVITIEIHKKLATSDAVQQKSVEAKNQLELIKPQDFVVLLDERGKVFTSVAMAKELEKWANRKNGTICFIIGGAYGFTDEVRAKADAVVSLSKLTFSHQLVRLIFAEQIYRLLCILKGHPYHHE